MNVKDDLKTQKHTIEYDGHKIAYDANAIRRISVLRKLSTYETNPAAYFEAIDQILMGKLDEVAEVVGDSFEDLNEIVNLIGLAAGGEAKN